MANEEVVIDKAQKLKKEEKRVVFRNHAASNG
jgi:hypothetical protein